MFLINHVLLFTGYKFCHYYDLCYKTFIYNCTGKLGILCFTAFAWLIALSNIRKGNLSTTLSHQTEL